MLHGMNVERCLLAGEAFRLDYAALEKATKYARHLALGLEFGVFGYAAEQHVERD